jgi:hypothetical protein
MIDFIRLFKDYNIDFITNVEGWVNINCPLGHSNGVRGYKGGFNLADGHYNCWVCSGAQIEEVLSKLLNISFYETKILLQDYSTDTVARPRANKKKGLAKSIKLPGYEIAKNSKAWDYLVNRDFDPQYLIDTYKIQDGGLVGYWSFRIIIPIFYHNVIVSYQGRSLYSKKKCLELDILRYQTLDITSSVIDAKKVLYNLDNCTEDWVVLHEGVTDVWRLGYKNCCATLGTEMSEDQIILLAKRFNKVIFLFDNEKEAQSRAKKYGERLVGLGVEAEIFNPEFVHDPGDYNLEEEKFVRRELCLTL